MQHLWAQGRDAYKILLGKHERKGPLGRPRHRVHDYINPLNAELNPICHLLALLGAHPILRVSRIRVKIGIQETRRGWGRAWSGFIGLRTCHTETYQS